MYFVYLLKSKNFGKIYVGMTCDVARRLEEHNNGYSKYTKRYLPWILLYTESFEDRNIARAREKYFKSCAGRKRIKQIINYSGIV